MVLIRCAAATLFTVGAMCGGSSGAAEVIGKVTQAKDWSKLERLEYRRASIGKTGPEIIRSLPQFPTFLTAANVNTQANRAQEYTSITQRNAYYDLMSVRMEFDPETPDSLRGVKFFAATTIVTIKTMLGLPEGIADDRWGKMLNTTDFCVKTSPETRSFIAEVNSQLFALNMGMLRNLLFVWRRPQHPSSGSPKEIKAYDFDLAMVELEQSTVEAALTAMKPSATVRKELNRLFGDCWYQKSIVSMMNPVGESAGWAERARNAPFDFFEKRHRVLLGQAIVTLLHRKKEADFRVAAGLPPLPKP